VAQPSPLFRRALRIPTLLYRIGAGPLLGHRFLLLTNRGRRSGRIYRTILEVVSWDVARREAVVMSGFGPRAGWYLNVLDGGAEEVRIAAARFHPAVRELETDEAVRVVAGYERRNRFVAPVVRVIFSRLAGFRYDGSEEARERLVDALPLLAFREPSTP
jgi:deazaflavin-dependent oxidoreductase (nitroreductase family)